MNKPRKKNIVALLAGVAVAAAVTASAASLGGLTTQHLGANSNEVVAPVTKGVTVDWQTTYDSDAGHYVVSDFELEANGKDGIPEGAEVRITVTGAGEESLAEYVSTDGGATYENPENVVVAAHDVHGASVVIIGGDVTSGENK